MIFSVGKIVSRYTFETIMDIIHFKNSQDQKPLSQSFFLLLYIKYTNKNKQSYFLNV